MYQTKRSRITNYLKNIFDRLRDNGKTANKSILIATVSLELGVREREVEDVLNTYAHANMIEIKDGDILL